MAEEIELKLLLSEEAAKSIPTLLTEHLQLAHTRTSSELYNSYFDTPEHYFRKHGMAFRIRAQGGVFEQTIKTKGTVSGGLHQRPEHNVAIASPRPELSLFDQRLWPDHTDPNELQGSLECLFETTFTREAYRFQFAGSEIELVFDMGSIETAKEQLAICEVELELLSGCARDLVKIATQWRHHCQFRLSAVTKAQRGYQLVAGIPLARLTIQDTISKQSDGTVEQVLCECLRAALNCWQHCERVLLEEHKLREIHAIGETIHFAQFVLQQFADITECQALLLGAQQLSALGQQWQWSERFDALRELRSKRGAFRKKLAGNPLLLRELQTVLQSLLAQHQPTTMVWHGDCVAAQLLIVELLLTRPWRSGNADGSPMYQRAFAEFARGWVGSRAEQIKNTLATEAELSHT